ncbi:entericidin A/B family lipoprotein [Pseudomonas sp.]|jgi:entericidin B|nr:entericidin A/B family lipoprotein [Pseudomonas sp.]
MSTAFKSLLLSALMVFGVVGCNTMEGAGRDVERGGEAIQRQAR